MNFFTSKSERFDIEVQMSSGKKITVSDVDTMMLVIMNGKFGGGRIVLSPSALLNDGLADLCM